MRKILTILIITISLNCFAQEWSPIGAKWHYTQWGNILVDYSFKTIESIADSIINGEQCKRLIEKEIYYSDTITRNHYMYSENDSVFFYKDDEFHLLYDFGAIAGDTIVLSYFWTGNGDSLLMIIDSTSTIDINGEIRKIQYITCGDGYTVEFGNEVIEGIGSTFFMFRNYDGMPNGPLRCYEDSIVGLFLSPYHLPNNGWSFEECDEIITGIDEMDADGYMSIYPNPAHSEVIISGIEDNALIKVSLYNMTGQRVLHQQGVDRRVDISKLQQGMYVLEVMVGEDRIRQKLIIQ